MLTFLAVVVVVATVAADQDTEWTVFKAKYNKKYNPEIENVRKYIWSENKKFIEEHNEKFKLGLSSYYLDENEYADMTNSEFVYKMTGLKVEKKVEQNSMAQKGPQVNPPKPPKAVDWRTKGFVTPVKNQGDCACSWAFSATGAMEGNYYMINRKLISMSESNLVDCTQPFGNEGCLYGTMTIAFRYTSQFGIESEATYPYTPKENLCKHNESNALTKFIAYGILDKRNDKGLQEFVSHAGPVSAGIDGSHQSFQFYSGGIYNEPNCSSIDLNHGVLVVGYDTDQGDDYWIVKNSWGTSWGEKGYIRMSRNKDNQCGIATMVSYPVIHL